MVSFVLVLQVIHGWVHLPQLGGTFLDFFLVRGQEKNSAGKVVTQFLKMWNREVMVLELTTHRTGVRAFDCV